MQRTRLSGVSLGVVGMIALAGAASGQPVNTTLPGGWSWLPVGGGSYDTGTLGTKRGGFNGQTSGPYNDTSFGIMDEQNTPWFDGSDQSEQQYVQAQAFGNFGTNAPPGPSGRRFYNFGYGSTAAGSNFPSNAAERRTITMNHWNNPNPDAGGVASLGQIVWVPVSATFTGGVGFGADEMQILAIGGNGGGTSKFTQRTIVNAGWSTTGLGGINNTGNTIDVTSVTEVFDPGPAFGFYNVPTGFGGPSASGQINRNVFGTVIDQGVNIGAAGQGIPVNSIGTGLSDSYNVLSSILQDGSSFTLTFDATATTSIFRDFGNADGRAQAGPGFEGTGRLVVTWAAFQAVPTPGAMALLGLGALAAGRRKR